VNDDVLVNLPAGDLVEVAYAVLPDTSPLAGQARMVADEILRLRDAGQLSKWVAGEIASMIYQAGMHSSHIGDFQLTAPIRSLAKQFERLPPAIFPDVQVDPVQVSARFAQIAAEIRQH
jgi:hypothetical protein